MSPEPRLATNWQTVETAQRSNPSKPSLHGPAPSRRASSGPAPSGPMPPKLSRRTALVIGGSAMAVNHLAPRSIAQDHQVDPIVDRSIQRALDFLTGVAREDGSLTDRGHATAMSALSIMAFASIGIVGTDPSPRGRVVDAALQYVLQPENQDAEGYYGRRDSSRMYGHGITTLMLTELLGMGRSINQNATIHASLDRAIDLILASQAVPKPAQHQGGWRYAPDSRDSDLSVSVWQLMALRSAKNDDLAVPGDAIDSAVAYLANSFKDTTTGSDDRPVGGFTYTPGGGRATFTMTAAGLLAMQVCGQYDSPTVESSANYLLANPIKKSERFFMYGIYYYAQGMYQFGGEHSAAAAKTVSELLLPMQSANGSFKSPSGQEKNIGSVYATAMAVLALSVRYHYLPIYQR